MSDMSGVHRGNGSRRPLVQTLYSLFREPAEARRVQTVTIGLGYTAVATDDDCLGLSYTMTGDRECCGQLRRYRDLDGASAAQLLDCVRSTDSLERSMGIALINALNQRTAATLPQDSRDGTFIDHFGIAEGSRVSMVGFFPPIAARLEAAGVEVSVLDRDLGMGHEGDFLGRLSWWPEVLILTATTILNASFELFLDHTHRDVRTLVLGPTTPMVPEAYEGFRVAMLGGMVPLDNERVTAAVRQAALTPAISRYCKKIFWARREQERLTRFRAPESDAARPVNPMLERSSIAPGAV